MPRTGDGKLHPLCPGQRCKELGRGRSELGKHLVDLSFLGVGSVSRSLFFLHVVRSSPIPTMLRKGGKAVDQGGGQHSQDHGQPPRVRARAAGNMPSGRCPTSSLCLTVLSSYPM